MDFCIVQNGMIANMIICENDEIAEEFGAVPSYEGARIGDTYDPPPTPPEPPALPSLEDRLAALEAENAALTAAIERGMQL